MNRDLHGNTHIKKNISGGTPARYLRRNRLEYLFLFHLLDAVFRYFRYLLYVRTP